MSGPNRISLGSLFDGIVQALQNDQGYLNHLDSNQGNGNHGNNILHNFQTISNIIHQNPQMNNQDVLNMASNALRQQGRGHTANIYASGLSAAGNRIQGQQGISLDQVVPFLEGLLGGTQSATQARPGQGTMMDSLIPGIETYLNDRKQGQNNQQSIVHALTNALSNSRRVQSQPAMFGNARQNANQSWVDPGAASGVSVLSGLFNQISKL